MMEPLLLELWHQSIEASAKTRLDNIHVQVLPAWISNSFPPATNLATSFNTHIQQKLLIYYDKQESMAFLHTLGRSAWQ